MERCRRLPGKALFQYLDEHGKAQCIDSVAVNAYLREITGQTFTAKNFRTWAATVLAAKAVCDLPECTSDSAFKRNIVRAIDSVAAKLGNTRAVCRGSYIHPGVFDGYRRRHDDRRVRRQGPREAAGACRGEEAAVTGALLKRRAKPTSGTDKSRGRKLLHRAVVDRVHEDRLDRGCPPASPFVTFTHSGSD